MKRISIWLLVLGVLAAVVILLNNFVPEIPLVLDIVASVAILIFIVARSSVQVPQKEIWIIELFGKFSKELESGLHFLLPFGIETIRSKVFMGQQMMRLSLDETVQEGYGGGDVEFKDCSNVGVSAFFYFQIFDAKMATYEISSIFSAIEEKTDGILRVNFMMYNLDEAMNFKGKFNIKNIVCFTNLVAPLASVDPSNLPAVIDDQIELNYESSEFYVSLRSYGVEPKSFVISDFRLPDNVVEQRQRRMTAEADKEVAKIALEKAAIEKKITIVQATGQKQAAILKAEGGKQAQVLEGEGEASRITSVLGAAKLEAGQTGAYLTEIQKWKAVAESTSGDKVILVEGSGEAALGTKFGVGFNSTNSKRKIELKK